MAGSRVERFGFVDLGGAFQPGKVAPVGGDGLLSLTVVGGFDEIAGLLHTRARRVAV